MIDPDFPPPPPHVQIGAELDDIHKARVAYEASPDFAQVKSGHVIDRAFHALNGLASHDSEATAWATYGWMQCNEAGMPWISALESNTREDARFWAETATPPELECYALAAMDRLGGMSGGQALFASRQIKRLAGALFRRMSPAEQAAFANWISEQMKDAAQ